MHRGARRVPPHDPQHAPRQSQEKVEKCMMVNDGNIIVDYFWMHDRALDVRCTPCPQLCFLLSSFYLFITIIEPRVIHMVIFANPILARALHLRVTCTCNTPQTQVTHPGHQGMPRNALIDPTTTTRSDKSGVCFAFNSTDTTDTPPPTLLPPPHPPPPAPCCRGAG